MQYCSFTLMLEYTRFSSSSSPKFQERMLLPPEQLLLTAILDECNIHASTVAGFTVRDRGCCGVEADQGQTDCIPLTPPCQNRSEYVFWDAFHPTEAANRVLAQRVYAGSPPYCYPINVSQLVMI